jgi:CRISPR-associated protein Cst1
VIRYTGNPYVDAGVAVLELRLQKPCDEMTLEDLASQAEEIRKEYTKLLWKSYLMVHLPNCAWTQKDISSGKNQAYLGKVLESYTPEYPELNHKCAFCGRPAKIFGDRRYVPLLTGETVMSSGAAGIPGLPVCGWCVFAAHFYPFATLKVDGRPLFWWTPDPAWTRRLTLIFVERLDRILGMSSDELLKLRWPKTRLLQAAREAMERLEIEQVAPRPALSDVTGIHATNYGTDPSFEELHIPRGLLEFWREAGSFPAYKEIEHRSWETADPKPKTKKGRQGKRPGRTAEDSGQAKPEISAEIFEFTRRNYLYEALGEAFRSEDYRDQAKRVAAKFFLAKQGKRVEPTTIKVTELFLEKVACMERERLEAIREIADHIADHLIIEAGDHRAAGQLTRRKLRLGEFLQFLSYIQRKLSDVHKPLQWEKVLTALNLESDVDRTATDHWLVQDLILIRLYERLANSPALAELPEPDAPELASPVQAQPEKVN